MDKAFSRREFLGTAAAGMALAGQFGSSIAGATEPQAWPKLRKVRIHRVYAGTSGGGWPGPSFDADAEIARYERHLAELGDELDDVKFVGGEQVKSAEEAAQVAAGLGDADGLLVFALNFGDGRRVRPLVDAGLPTVIFFYPFTGHQWMYFSQWKRVGDKLLLLPTSDYGEIRRAVTLLRVPGLLQQSRVLAVGRPKGTAAACSPEQLRDRLGSELVPVNNERVIEAHKAVDPQAAEAEAGAYWMSQAQRIVEPPKADIVNSARLFLAMKRIMIEERAQAITSSHCMGAPAKGCLAFSKLNDLGFVGACEGDMDSTLTMLIFAYAFGIPGFISDPLFDLSKNALIHAHCTSATMLDGPGGERAPFLMRTQCDTEQGVSLEVKMRIGQEVTCAKLANLETMLVSTGKITEIPNYEDRGCRTQITTEVRDARRMLDNWGSEVLPNDMMTLLHRVVFYGDHLRDVTDLAALMGLQVVEEG
jgi:hypothetical protein